MSHAPSWAPSRSPLASWGPRFLARLIDILVVVVPALLIGAVLALMLTGLLALIGRGGLETSFAILNSVAAFVLGTAYEAVSVTRWRMTLGMRVLGLRVAPLSGAGYPGPLPVMASVARGALLWSPVIFGFSAPAMWTLAVLALVLFGLWPLWDRPNRQGLHDKVAGTVVLSTR
ncbi:RDD family protein [Nocardiopsis suaedae]|uniref:RDD family protein n=1 Tax=Nocardiopsis suaedae TaxID=3018444 RepID=A0ABT4TU00_9ACTN|nr:RDD family protein [Nocardiopsis suaedae]MDA2808117.1 RDD family protein [Nocardiopsis suaedae]